jgi:hypothetical protein
MKTKPLTLILTLLFCLSGSAFAEAKDKSSDAPEERPSLGAAKIFVKLNKNEKRFHEIVQNLIKTKNVNGVLDLGLEQERNMAVISNLAQVQTKLELIWHILSYEDHLIKMNDDESITHKHNYLRKSAFKSYMDLVNLHINNFKKMRVMLSTTAGVLELNTIIENLEELKLWVSKEENLILKGNRRIRSVSED